jgi:hypothetical protein
LARDKKYELSKYAERAKFDRGPPELRKVACLTSTAVKRH